MNDEHRKKLAAVREQLGAARGREARRGGGGYLGYGEAARSAAVGIANELTAMGVKGQQVALAIGVHESTLATWCKAAGGRVATIPDTPTAFAEVRVAESAKSSTLRFVLPSGAHIDGLDLPTLIALVRALA